MGMVDKVALPPTLVATRMLLPLPVRALLRRPLRRVLSALTRRPSVWTPDDDGRGVYHWDHARLCTAGSAGAVRDALRRGSREPWWADGPNELAFAIAQHAGSLSPALADWCLVNGENPAQVARTMSGNPAATPQVLAALRLSAEEQLWRDWTAARMDRARSVAVGPEITLAERSFADLTVAWLAARRAGLPDPGLTPFITRAIRAQCQKMPDVLGMLLDRHDIPLEFLAEIKKHLANANAEFIRRVCRRTPCPLTVEDARALLTSFHLRGRRTFLASTFEDLPIPLQQACWPIVFAAIPTAAVRIMARSPVPTWPGLTVEVLSSVLSDPDSEARLAAIQVLARLSADTPQPVASPVASPVVQRAPVSRPVPAGVAADTVHKSGDLEASGRSPARTGAR